MKINRTLLLMAVSTAMSLLLPAVSTQGKTIIRLFNSAKFYDGYLLENNPDSLVDDGILRHSTSLYAVKMTDEQLAKIGETLAMNVTVYACCDNYDRIGNINLAFVPKGSESYEPDSVARIEIGRFITPFMDMNKSPKSVPYAYDIDYLSHVLRDNSIREAYDIWVEFELFGVPYAANEQIEGCAGRSDVFQGWLAFSTDNTPAALTDKDVLVPIVIKKPEYKGNNLNNYNAAGTDTIGKTTKTYVFDVPRDVADAQIVLITSNHGANTDGEEYNRRWHYVYVDDQLALTYKPGRSSCEPFRKYNTQVNGIYGYSKMTDTQWQSFSNWCPGDVIDNRIICLGAVKAGKHKVRISVPEAQFADGQGDIPVSMFFQGLTEGTLTSIADVAVPSANAQIQVKDGNVSVDTELGVMAIEVYDMQGKCLSRAENTRSVPRPANAAGVCLVNVELSNGMLETHKVLFR